MSILRYTASLDNTITNAFEEDLSTRGTGSNMGASDILEVFSIYGQESTTSSELSRILINFPMTQIEADRASGVLPTNGVTWKLKLYNAPHFNPVPKSYELKVSAVSASWEEGTGLDMEAYSDLTNDDIGSNWLNAKTSTVSSSATITVNGSPANEETLILTDAAGTSITITSDNTLGNGLASGTKFGPGGTTTNVRDAIKSAIDNATILITTANSSTNKITLTQTNTGPAGDTAVTNNLTNVVVAGGDGTGNSNRFDGGGRWDSAGGDYHGSPNFTQSFDSGLENLDLNVTSLVEEWLLGPPTGKTNYGFGIKLNDSFESATKSYYTKKFYGRGTEFFFKRPVLEAQFNDTTRDDRGNFHISSSLLPAADNLNTLFFYNKFRGRLVDIAGSTAARPVLKLYHSSGSVPEGTPKGFLDQAGSATTALSASRVDTGLYKVQIAATSSIVSDSYPYLVDVWYSGSKEVFTGSVITPKTYKPETYEESPNFVLSMTNLKPEYGKDDLAKLRVYAREKNWSPNIYTVAKSKPENKLIISGSYKVIRMIDDLTVVDYGTGSLKYTELSYDQNGNYFEFNMDMLEPGYQYGFKFSIYDDYTQSYLEQPYIFKFRVS